MDERDGSTATPRSETAIKAALSLVPAVGGTLATIVGDEMERRRGRVLESTDTVISAVGPTELVKRLEDDERLTSLFTEALEASARTTLAEKRRAMAIAISRAVLDSAAIDEAHLVVAALADLDVPHLRELERFRRRVDAADPDRDDLASQMVETSGTGMAAPIEAALVRHGCLWSASVSVLGGRVTHWGVTGFGRHILRELRHDPLDA